MAKPYLTFSSIGKQLANTRYQTEFQVSSIKKHVNDTTKGRSYFSIPNVSYKIAYFSTIPYPY